jgi:hypothetical protein
MFQDQETVKAAYYEISREEIADLLNYAYRLTLNRNHHVRNSIGDIRRKLRREVEAENSKLVPMKATHFEKSDPLNKKSPTAFQKIRSFGSLESLFRPKRRNNKSGENGETHSCSKIKRL